MQTVPHGLKSAASTLSMGEWTISTTRTMPLAHGRPPLGWQLSSFFSSWVDQGLESLLLFWGRLTTSTEPLVPFPARADLGDPVSGMLSKSSTWRGSVGRVPEGITVGHIKPYGLGPYLRSGHHRPERHPSFAALTR